MSNINEAMKITPKEKSNAKHKDRLLRALFKNPERALELCTALVGVEFPKDTKVELYDLETSLVKRYNDLAISVDDQLLFMVEHSSTISPNFPLRLLSHITDVLYGWFIETDQLYRNKLYKIPEPKCYVLYNGVEPLKETELKLSKSFKTNDGSDKTFNLELIVPIIDVNHNSDNDILKRSKSLEGYAYLIDNIRCGMRQGLSQDKAIKEAISHCISVGILADFLKVHYEEVSKMLVWEYDQEAEFKAIRADGIEQGIEKGIEQGIEQGIEKVAKNMLEQGTALEVISKYTGLPIDAIKKL